MHKCISLNCYYSDGTIAQAGTAWSWFNEKKIAIFIDFPNVLFLF